MRPRVSSSQPWRAGGGTIPSILIVDDHSFIRRGIRGMLDNLAEWQVCGEAGNGHEAIAMANELRPDVVLLDVSMPGLSGLEAARFIRARDSGVRIILLTLHDSQELVRNAFRAGVNGYLLKTDAESELVRALQIVIGGGTYLSPKFDPGFAKTLISASAQSLPPRG